MARIEKITTTVEMADGNVFTLVTHHPLPYGDNPRFVAQQAANGMAELDEQVGGVLQAHYGEQVIGYGK